MYKDIQRQLTQTGILSLACQLGVVTHAQLRGQDLIHPSRLTSFLRRLVSQGYVEELPGRTYYARSGSRSSPVYKLSQAGADWLKANGRPSARPSGLRGEASINHALAVLDCRLALLRLGTVEITTDRQIPYGQSVLRPDNLVAFKDGTPSILVESESLALARSAGRLRKKVAHLTDFFASQSGYDPNVRIVYLWRRGEHEQAMTLWTRACHAERLSRGLEALPFSLLFIAHSAFIENAPLQERFYESLPLGGTLPTPEAAQVEAANAVPQASRRIGEDGPLLDQATLDFLCAFRALYERGLSRMSELDALLKLVREFLSERAELTNALAWNLRSVARSNSYISLGCSMEETAKTLFEKLGVPALLGEGQSELEVAAITVQAFCDGRSRPGVSVKINARRAAALLMGWEDTPEALAQTFEALLRILFNHGRRIDLILSVTETKEKEK